MVLQETKEGLKCPNCKTLLIFEYKETAGINIKEGWETYVEHYRCPKCFAKFIEE